MNTPSTSPSIWLIAGDGLTLLIITIIGFATHGETSASFIPRMAATWILRCSWAGSCSRPRWDSFPRRACPNYGVLRWADSSRRNWPSSCAD